MTLQVRRVDQSSAGAVHDVIRRAFGGRAPLDPPASALVETVETVSAALAERGGLLATLDGEPSGCMVFGPADDPALYLTRFGVVPDAQGTGVAGALVRAAERKLAAAAMPACRSWPAWSCRPASPSGSTTGSCAPATRASTCTCCGSSRAAGD
ncbi:GNAT family N-acetyltransferase [Nocardioides alcanivorans]|uniref:GNAT family N-acetyltransferase n=1 Tax=Nocardioides alcanivorans TaxID=2897352 RepID=UPI001F268878|nr:GNAT family N-acetyltransferase [Nocardioides alcanivorans]